MSVVVTWNTLLTANHVNVYFNGVLGGSGTLVNAAGGSLSFLSTFTIGQPSSQSFDGLVSDVLLMNRAISADEVKRLYVEPYCMFEGGMPAAGSSPSVAAILQQLEAAA